MNSERKVLVTGFGPYAGHEVNASWEAVQELYKFKDDLQKRLNVNLIIDHIPVVYDHVATKIPQLWEEHNPQIALHVGVSQKVSCLTIENEAHATGYNVEDVSGKFPTKKEESSSSSVVLETGIDVEKLCREINDKGAANGYEACVSHDAGRYLCEYIFYQSLCIQPARTLFIHVPELEIYTSQVTAKGLYDIIECLVQGSK